MTQKEKQLVLKDLCARLPYGVIVRYKSRESEGDVELGYGNICHISDIGKGWWIEAKPYLRPMSSMTEEEKKEFNKLIGGENTNWNLFDENRIAHCKSFYSVFCYFSTMGKIIDFFNLQHLDYRGLISMGLAIEALEDMYNIK